MRRAALQQSVFLYHNSNLELLLLSSSVGNLKCTEDVFSVELKQTSHETKQFFCEFPP
jgi:hypothetical protein